jgi:hypothetical protein
MHRNSYNDSVKVKVFDCSVHEYMSTVDLRSVKPIHGSTIGGVYGIREEAILTNRLALSKRVLTK